MMSGFRSYFRNEEVKHATVPRYKQLSMKQVLKFAMQHEKIKWYLPEITSLDEPQVDRTFLFSVVNTIEPNYFQ